MPENVTPDRHTTEGQVERAARIEEALEELQHNENAASEGNSVRERLDKAAADFKSRQNNTNSTR